MKTVLLVISLFCVSIPGSAQIHSTFVTINGDVMSEDVIDSLLNGTWYSHSDGYVTFLSFNHFLLFQYKSKGDSIIWLENQHLYCTNGTIDSLLYKPIRYGTMPLGHSIKISYDIKNHEDAYDTYTTQYRGYFGNLYFTGDTLMLAEHAPGAVTSSRQMKRYLKLPDRNNRQVGLSDSGFTNKAEAKNQLIGGVREGKWLQYTIYYPFEFEDTIYTIRDTAGHTRAFGYSLTVYRHGIPYGLSRGYDTNWKLIWEVPYINGYRNGIGKGYYPNEKLRWEAPYFQDELNGKVIHYNDDGTIESTFYYIYGELNDTAKYYGDSGKLWSETPYSDNYINGIVTDYDEKGRLIREIPFNYGLEDGDEMRYYKSGLVMNKTTWRDDSIVADTNYDEKGNVLNATRFPRNTKREEIFDLIQGDWVSVEDTATVINITKNELTEHGGHYDRYEGIHGHFTLNYFDSTEKRYSDLSINGWAGYCLISKNNFFIQVYSINKYYMVFDDDLILKRKNIHTN